jgi:hypothetical protein
MRRRGRGFPWIMVTVVLIAVSGAGYHLFDIRQQPVQARPHPIWAQRVSIAPCDAKIVNGQRWTNAGGWTVYVTPMSDGYSVIVSNPRPPKFPAGACT